MTERELPDYSVLMSVYKNDKARFLDAAIQSMAGQTIPFHDMVLVCDGPVGEEIESVLCKWSTLLSERMTICRLPINRGLGNALNEGVPLCKCDVVARMDSDDISRSFRCEILLRHLVEGRFDLVGGAIEEFDITPGDMGVVRMPPLEMSEISRRIKFRNPFNHVTVLFKREAVIKAGGYQPFPWLEDYWLWARMIASGCKCENISDVVVDVRVGDGMYARRSNLKYLKSQIAFFRELKKLRLTNRAEEAAAIGLRSIATFLPTSLLRLAYNNVLRSKINKEEQ